jgi:predicted polyphosphate/ATP-dependent NAD kinase
MRALRNKSSIAEEVTAIHDTTAEDTSAAAKHIQKNGSAQA